MGKDMCCPENIQSLFSYLTVWGHLSKSQVYENVIHELESMHLSVRRCMNSRSVQLEFSHISVSYFQGCSSSYMMFSNTFLQVK